MSRARYPKALDAAFKAMFEDNAKMRGERECCLDELATIVESYERNRCGVWPPDAPAFEPGKSPTEIGRKRLNAMRAGLPDPVSPDPEPDWSVLLRADE